MTAIKETENFSEKEAFFWRIYRSKYCKESSILNLKRNYSMPEILQLHSNILLQEAVDEAYISDSNAANKRKT